MIFYIISLLLSFMCLYLFNTLYEYEDCQPEDKIRFPIILWILAIVIALIPGVNIIVAIIGLFFVIAGVMNKAIYSNSWLFKRK